MLVSGSLLHGHGVMVLFVFGVMDGTQGLVKWPWFAWKKKLMEKMVIVYIFNICNKCLPCAFIPSCVLVVSKLTKKSKWNKIWKTVWLPKTSLCYKHVDVSVYGLIGFAKSPFEHFLMAFVYPTFLHTRWVCFTFVNLTI